jgi:hypothetical protein
VNSAIIARRLSAEGKRAGAMKDVFKFAQVQLVNPSSQKEEDPSETNFAIAIIAGMVLYMTLIVYGMSTMHSVMEEKSTRMIEILVSSIRPFDLLAGKILSVGAVALTQYLVWAVTVGVLFASAASGTLRGGRRHRFKRRRSAAGADAAHPHDSLQFHAFQRDPEQSKFHAFRRPFDDTFPLTHSHDPSCGHADSAPVADRPGARVFHCDHHLYDSHFSQNLPGGHPHVRETALD